jgi:hypothetical protein
VESTIKFEMTKSPLKVGIATASFEMQVPAMARVRKETLIPAKYVEQLRAPRILSLDNSEARELMNEAENKCSEI